MTRKRHPVHVFLDRLEALGERPLLGLPLRVIYCQHWHEAHAGFLTAGLVLLGLWWLAEWTSLLWLAGIVAGPSATCVVVLFPILAISFRLLDWGSSYSVAREMATIDCDTLLVADEEGVWRLDEGGCRTGIAWQEIQAVIGYKETVVGVNELFACVTLSGEHGDRLQLYHRWRGFGKVVEALTMHLPGIPPDWFTLIEAAEANQPVLEVWRRR